MGGEKKALRVLRVIDDGYSCSKLATQIVEELRGVGVDIDYRGLPKLRSDLIEGLARQGVTYTTPQKSASNSPQDFNIRSPSLWSGSSFEYGPRSSAGIGSATNPATPSPPRDPLRPPSYEGLRTYRPDQSVLSELGVQSVQDMVDQINRARINSKRFPISQGDYPGSKALFEKLVREFRSLTRNDHV